MYEFENAHIVRLCSSKRCKSSIHGHSYKCEVLLKADGLDNAGMVYDFGLMKRGIRQIIDSFDHSTTIFAKDSEDYKNAIKSHSERWIEIPLNPTAEQFCRIFFAIISKLLSITKMQNAEKGVKVYSVIIHETASGYAQCFEDDINNENMGKFSINDIVFSNAIKDEWDDKNFYENIINNKLIINPKEC